MPKLEVEVRGVPRADLLRLYERIAMLKNRHPDNCMWNFGNLTLKLHGLVKYDIADGILLVSLEKVEYRFHIPPSLPDAVSTTSDFNPPE